MLLLESPCSPWIINKFPPSSKYWRKILNSSGVNKAFGSPITIKLAERSFSSLNSFFIKAVYNLLKFKLILYIWILLLNEDELNCL